MRSSITLLAALLVAACAARTKVWPAHSPARAVLPVTLELTPAAPPAGGRIAVRYAAAPGPVPAERLQLRARLRTPTAEAYNGSLGSRTVAVLERGADGAFHGSLELPSDVVYAALAVEDSAGGWVDARGGRFWEVLVHDDSGRPTVDALAQRFNDWMGRDQLEVLRTAQRMTELHPAVPGGWVRLNAAESWVYGGRDAEARATAHRERLHQLDRALRERDVAETDIGDLYWYAYALDEDEIAARWHERLAARYPQNQFLLQERLGGLRSEHGEDRRALLAALDTAWEGAGREGRSTIAGMALSLARQEGDGPLLLHWADRVLALDGEREPGVAATLAGIPATRSLGIRRLAAAVARVEAAPDTVRELGAGVVAHAQALRNRAAALRLTLGRALLADGQVHEAVASLARAAEAGWSTERFRALGEARLAAGDTVGALRDLASAAADPGFAAARADSLRRLAHAEAAEWDSELAAARGRMVARTLEQAQRDSVPVAHLGAGDGTTVRLQERLGAEATVVVFWSRYCGFSVEAMPAIASLSARLAEQGVPLLAVTNDAQAEAEAYLADAGHELAVLYDVRGEAARALRSWGTPQFFVLDGAGRLRFESSLESAVRHVAALRAEKLTP